MSSTYICVQLDWDSQIVTAESAQVEDGRLVLRSGFGEEVAAFREKEVRKWWFLAEQS